MGLGDSHGGNVMVANKCTQILYIDYEVAGFHSPFLDQAKPIYNDVFFNIMYADMLSEDITVPDNDSGALVAWEVAKDSVCMDLQFHPDTLARVLAIAKLEYVLRPVSETLNAREPGQAQFSYNVLANALFSCAILTRDLSGRADVFYLNLAMGVLLASDMRKVFSDFYGWNDLPSTATEELGLVSTKSMRVDDDSEPLSATMVATLMGWLMQSSSTLEPDNVFLKRASDTFGLHKAFSRTSDEGPGAILHRIRHARKMGMKVAAHTCIRESLFAEPRIDIHFSYSTILKAAKEHGLTLIDVGCCMGTDMRKLIHDGLPSEKVMGLDVEEAYMTLGHAMFNDRIRIPFRKADMLQPDFFTKNKDLDGKFDIVHTSNVIHLFSEKQQELFFRNLARLVKPGGIIWGRQVGLADNEQKEVFRWPDGKGARFTVKEFWQLCQRVTGWRANDVEYEATLVRYDELRAVRPDKLWALQWLIRTPHMVRLEGAEAATLMP